MFQAASYQAHQEQGPDEPVTWDRKVDQFDKRLSLVRRQFRREAQREERLAWEKAARGVPLYEFWFKYDVRGGRLQRAPEANQLVHLRRAQHGDD